MRMHKLSALVSFAALVLAAVACNKTQDTGDAKVGFAQQQYDFVFEEGPNFTVPIAITGDNIIYPITVKVGSAPETEENGYSERNVDYRFIEREVVVNSAEDKPEVTVRVINSKITSLKMEITFEAFSGAASLGPCESTIVNAMPEYAFCLGDYTASGTDYGGDVYSETWSFSDYGQSPYVYLDGVLGIESTSADSDKEIGKLLLEASREIDEETEEPYVVMGLPLGYNNYISVVTVDTDGDGTDDSMGVVAPIVCQFNSSGKLSGVYSSGDVGIYFSGHDSFQVGLSSSQGLAYAIFLYNSTKKSFSLYNLYNLPVFYTEGKKITSGTTSTDSSITAFLSAFVAGQELSIDGVEVYAEPYKSEDPEQ